MREESMRVEDAQVAEMAALRAELRDAQSRVTQLETEVSVSRSELTTLKQDYFNKLREHRQYVLHTCFLIRPRFFRSFLLQHPNLILFSYDGWF